MRQGGGFGEGGPMHRVQNRGRAKLEDVSTARIYRLFRGYRWQLAAILVMALGGAVLGLIPPLVMKEIIDHALPDGDRRQLVLLTVLMVLLPLLSGLLGVWQNHENTKVGQGVMRDLRQSLFGNLQRQAMSFFTDAKSGEIIQRLTGDVQAVQNVVTTLVVSAVTQSVIVLTTVVILFALDWQLAILSVAVLPLFLLPVRRVSAVRKKLRGEAQRVRGDMSARLGELFGVSGAMLTRIFQGERRQQEQFAVLNEKVMDLELRLNLVGRWYGMVIGVLGPLGTALIYLYGGWKVIDGSMTIGSIVAFAAYLGRLYGPVGTLLNLRVEVGTALGVFQRLFEYQDLVPEVREAENAKVLPPVRGHIAYRSVSYAYQPGQYALRGVSFEAAPGEVVAIVGPSGAGKSTLIGMLARLYDPTEGEVTVDGQDIRSVTLESLRSQVAFVTQESFLFHASVRDNLLFARADASPEELEEACRQAYIHEVIASLPAGYDTEVGERGHRLSGGERQRLAIARAILKNPRILILDEATSHLDSASEAYVQAALDELMRGRTTLVIAHRLSTILSADRIVVLEGGRVAESGRHEELLEKRGLYAKLFHTQFAAGGTPLSS
ncbi:multidrug ABC transporter ATPase and permease [Paenibacillus mucilaginosus 3016]|uniref:Multidrug ABC transporter ATPase and permease n=2 Tax=Paenibacillus mucilaginosus TaxID=61624 RepID=H6N963_9BACL|nr:ABC transporter ATP-binding protein [Paenibacillus mucilaginosus]AFC27809.1 multidrug ABC transporter ATPase and permease [Paenibacillus mucilaginosus 3016]AGN70476.1 thiamine ABC transporter permease [Paenibacillus mucilaginosus K02]WFA16677.1 ABC transporter ATP-binding protein [Paenibacillus mucilaginosus]